MFVVEPIGNRNLSFVPPLVARLVASDQQNRHSQGIECVESSQRPSLVLNPQFAHMSMPGTNYARAERKSQTGAMFLQQIDHGANALLFAF